MEANPREAELFGGPPAVPPSPALGGAFGGGPEVELDYAGIGVRLAAFFIDLMVTFVLVSVLALVLGLSGPEFFTQGEGVTVLDYLGYVLPLAYAVLFIGLRGQTIGKMVVGVKVIREDGSLPGLGSAALRETFGKLISGVALLLGYIWIGFDSKKQGWHDKIAGTVVVVVRRGPRYRGPVA